MRLQQRVHGVDHGGAGQVLGAVDGGDKVAPEIRQHFLPVQIAGGDFVELVLQVGGEIIFHVAAEEAFQEGDDHAAAVFRDEAPAVHAHVFAVLQHLDDRGIGRRAADALFFQRLDQAGFGEARRRLGEMLFRGDGHDVELLAFGHHRQQIAFRRLRRRRLLWRRLSRPFVLGGDRRRTSS